ncbi:nitroreductase family protein [Sphingomonas sp. 37zxx]|uniref:nitroreductase family protein n=1 Tax=Sphingomonas sp. 37zxx TaxID=1550073 RepID=UPI001E330956|nr:nitroreductase family protein [Sphingomonas sp. 37zxx]
MPDNPRMPAYGIDPLFAARWSPRAFDGSSIDLEALLPLFEAARWAPSAYNVQPWRFVYALRDTDQWASLLDTLVPFNRSWAASASALVYIVSDRFSRDSEGRSKGESYSHSFDAGAAWAQLALQAVRNGLLAHAMTGFDHDAARAALRLSQDYRIETAVAIGRVADPRTQEGSLRALSGRRPLEELVYEGNLGTD